MKILIGNKLHIKSYLYSLAEFGEIPEDFVYFTCRSNAILPVLLAKIFGLSTARYWTGNDAWRYKHSPFYRFRAKIINLFFDTHYFLGWHLLHCVCEDKAIEPPGHVAELCRPKYLVRGIKPPLCYTNKTTKRRKHDGIRIGYYDANGTFPNRYGQDLIERLKRDIAGVIWTPILPGVYKHEDMGHIYNRIDILVRPSRWDGDPFMVHEAIHYGVRCITTFSSNPKAIIVPIGDYETLLQTVKQQINEVDIINHRADPDNCNILSANPGDER